MNRLHIGTFDSERFWDSDEAALLPFIPDPQGDRVVSAMDELLFPFAGPGDLLVTRLGFDPVLKSYLSSLGIEFSASKEALISGKEHHEATLKSTTVELLREISLEKYHYEPWALLKSDSSLLNKLGAAGEFPSEKVVKKVNSKVWSAELLSEIGFENHSRVVRSSQDTEREGLELLARGAFLIKEPFGVSGRGNLLINSEKKLKRIVSRLQKQEAGGKKVCLILEPFLEKALDFSSLIRLEKTGDFTLLSVQEIINSQFGYLGSKEASQELLKKLKEQNYYKTVKKVVTLLYREGYWGNICIDSMVLSDGSLFPVVEVNARKSMGLINREMNLRTGREGQFQFLSLGYEQGSLSMKGILRDLEKRGLLFTGESGVLPMSSKTLFVNDRFSENGSFCKGKFYFSAVSPVAEVRALLRENLKAFFTEKNCKVYN